MRILYASWCIAAGSSDLGELDMMNNVSAWDSYCTGTLYPLQSLTLYNAGTSVAPPGTLTSCPLSSGHVGGALCQPHVLPPTAPSTVSCNYERPRARCRQTPIGRKAVLPSALHFTRRRHAQTKCDILASQTAPPGPGDGGSEIALTVRLSWWVPVERSVM